MERYAPYAGGSMIEDPNGTLVKYDDAQQAIAEAEQRGRRQLARQLVAHNVAAVTTDDPAYEAGQRDERARIRAGVKAIDPVEWALNPEPAVLAVIDARGKSVPRVLTADDPEPAVGSVVLLPEHPGVTSTATRGTFGWWRDSAWPVLSWRELLNGHGSVTLIHDAGGE